jgi:putative PEP-CTERM system histidine kinase
MFYGLPDLRILGDLLAVLTYGWLALHFSLSLVRGRVQVQWASAAYLAALCSTAAWAALAFVGATTRGVASLAGLWEPLADQLRYGLLFAFLLGLLRPSLNAPGRAEFRVFSVLSVASVGGATLIVVGAFAGLQSFELNGRPAAMAALVEAVIGLLLIEQLLRNLPPDSRWNAKPVCLGLAVIFVFDLFLFSQAALFRNFDSDAVSIRAAVHSIAVPLLFLAARRQADWLGKLHVSRAAVFQSATLLLVGAYLLLVSGVGYYVRYSGGEWGRALQLVLMSLALLALVVLVMSGAVRSRLRVYISKNFFNYRYDYREEWLRFTAVLSSGGGASQEVGETVIRAMANLLECPSGALWLRRGAELAQTARWNLPAVAERESASSAFSEFMEHSGWIIDLDEVRRGAPQVSRADVPAWLVGEPRYWLIVPLRVENALIGIVLLGRPRAAMEINWEVRDLLKTAASQASGYLAQMQAAEALLEARKFDAFNKMSAFVVHDLKNIITQLSLMMKNAQRLRDNPEFQQDMLDTVENSLEKMRQLMLQLREGEKPHGVSSGVDLAAIAQRLASAAAGKGRALELELQSRVSTRGHDERVERVIGHVVQNAFDATPADRRVSLRLDQTGSQARIQVVDQGCGMSEEFIQNRLFKPFQTTKSNGMGIGAYESYQYLQELGGKITVESKVNEGTTVTILLPLFHAMQAAELSTVGSR